MFYLYSFLFVGIVCAIGQIILDNTKWTPGHLTSFFVIFGAFLDTFAIYDWLIEKVGAGALVPITSFGHSLIHGSLNAAKESGILGLLVGMFDLTSAGIVAGMICAFFVALIFKPKH